MLKLSIADDDLCSVCNFCLYAPGELSYCKKSDGGQWPATFDGSGEAVSCDLYEKCAPDSNWTTEAEIDDKYG